MSKKMEIVPLTLDEANTLVRVLHRHHDPVHAHRFSIGLKMNGALVGAAICGRPTGQKNPHYDWLEVLRLATNGTPNACSKLYGSCARIAKEMGFFRIQTFILHKTEPGTSLKAAGWIFDHVSEGGNWKNRPGRSGKNNEPKERWIKILNP
jgi:hypothetical protein